MAGQDIDRPTSTRLPFVAAGIRSGFSQPLGARAFINAHADGLVILTRWTASLDDVPVWTMPRFAAAVGTTWHCSFAKFSAQHASVPDSSREQRLRSGQVSLL